MNELNEYLASLPVRIDELRRQLKPLETGAMRIGSKRVGHPEWVDETPLQIDHLKKAISEYERILSEYREKSLSND